MRDTYLRDTTLRDALLREGWRIVVLSMIFALVMAGLSMIYRALFAALDGAWQNTAGLLLASVLIGVCVKWLCDNRNELVES